MPVSRFGTILAKLIESRLRESVHAFEVHPANEPELVDTPPEGDGWLHEVKFDGYRTQVIKDAGGIRLLTKRGHDWTARYCYLAEDAAAIEAETFILNGETIIINEAGLSDFHALQAAVASARRHATSIS